MSSVASSVENGRHFGVEVDSLVARLRIVAGCLGRAERGIDTGVRAGRGHALIQTPVGALESARAAANG